MSRSRDWKPRLEVIGVALVTAALIATGACGGEEQGGTAAGDAAAAEVAALDYEVTPERYQQWVAAQQALDAIPGLPAPPKIDPLRLDQDQLNQAVRYLEGDARARAALAQAGISARDYVLTTIALDQALVTASASGGAPTPAGGASAPAVPGSAPVSGPPTSAGPTPSTPRAAAGGSRSTTPAARPAARLTGTPRRNVDLVRRNRGDVVRVMRTMRFRISEPAADDVADTSVTRSDSVTVGKDVTVKWDVTVRRNRDSAAARRARSDSTPPDSTRQ